MRQLLRWGRWLVGTLFLTTLISNLYTGWVGELLSLETASKWLHGQFVAWAQLYESNRWGFQVLTVHLLLAPIALGLLAVLALLFAVDRPATPPAVRTQLEKLEESLERFLLIYDLDYDFIGRLGRLAASFDETRFDRLRLQVFQLVLEYCGPRARESKEAVLIVPTPGEEGKAAISVVHEEKSESIVHNLLSVRACHDALTRNAPMLVSNARRQSAQIMAPSGWVLPDCGSLLVCPVRVGHEPRGIIGVYHTETGAFSQDVDEVFLGLMASILGLAYTIRDREVRI